MTDGNQSEGECGCHGFQTSLPVHTTTTTQPWSFETDMGPAAFPNFPVLCARKLKCGRGDAACACITTPKQQAGAEATLHKSPVKQNQGGSVNCEIQKVIRCLRLHNIGLLFPINYFHLVKT